MKVMIRVQDPESFEPMLVQVRVAEDVEEGDPVELTIRGVVEAVLPG